MSLNNAQPDLQKSYTEFDIAAAEAIAISLGRSWPNQSDLDLAVQKKHEWNKRRIELGLSEWV
jgi:hypothetical protein